MISDTEKRRFLLDLAGMIDEASPGHKRAQILHAIADDYAEDNNSIDQMKPWFEAQIAQGKTVGDFMVICDVPRHRILFALNKLGLKAPGMQV